VTLPETGDYFVVVNTARSFTVGRFTLSISPGAKAPSLTRCARGR
jgi:hypothetical protein